LSADVEARVDQRKASEMDLKNIVYRETDKREVLEYKYTHLSHECIYHMELREASDRRCSRRGGSEWEPIKILPIG
jgi:hypothetical protein